MNHAHHDLILRGARVIDPSQDIDRVTDLRFTNGKVAAIGDGLAGDANTEVRDVKGKIEDKAAFRKAVQPMYDDLKAVPAVAALAARESDDIEAVVEVKASLQCKREIADSSGDKTNDDGGSTTNETSTWCDGNEASNCSRSSTQRGCVSCFDLFNDEPCNHAACCCKLCVDEGLCGKTICCKS